VTGTDGGAGHGPGDSPPRFAVIGVQPVESAGIDPPRPRKSGDPAHHKAWQGRRGGPIRGQLRGWPGRRSQLPAEVADNFLPRRIYDANVGLAVIQAASMD
jgi:hypothetical protein